MKKRTVIYSDVDKILTNGKVYGEVIFLADGEKEEDYYEIPIEVYNRIQKEEHERIQG